MKILFLTHTFPFPLNDGVRLHIYHLLKELAKNHSLFLLSLNDVAVEKSEEEAIRQLGVTIVKVVQHHVPKSFFARFFNTFFDPVPFFVRQFSSNPLRDELHQFLSQQKIDLIHVDYLPMVAYHNEFSHIPSIFFPHDAMSMLFERNISSEKNLFRKFYTYLQWRKTKNFEAFSIPKFQGTMVVSPADRDYLFCSLADAKISVSPNGVDCDYFSPLEIEEEENSILFRGVMNFLPNLDAAIFFYQEIFSIVRKEIPNAKFYIVGKFPPKDLLKLADRDPHLIVEGYVPDLREYMAKASVIVCPMRIGSGIKNKILESMAMAKAVISTPLACAGIQVTNGETLFIEESAEGFAKKVIRLLRDRQMRKRIGIQARSLVKEHYTWKKNSKDFEKLYVEAIHSASGHR